VDHLNQCSFWTRASKAVVAVIAAMVVFGSGPAPVADASTPTANDDVLPVVWSGRLVSATGQPGPGGVAAYIRPPAGALPKISDTTPLNSLAPIEPILIGTATANDAGQFEIRGEPPAGKVPKSWYGSDGSLQIMVTATAADGESSLVFDTVHFLDQPGVGKAWFSDRQRFDRARAQAAATTGSADAARTLLVSSSRADQTAAVVDEERPSDLRMTFPATTAPTGQFTTAGVKAPPYNVYGQCFELGWVDQYNGKRAIAETSANTYWTIWSAYQTTRTTSWTIGVSKSGTSDWSVNGSKSLEDEVGLGLSTPMLSGASSDYRARHSVGTIQRKFKWDCTPGWPYELYPHFPVYTDEVVGMTGGHFRDDGRNGTSTPPKVPCDSRYKAPVPPNSTTRRLDGESATTNYSVAGWGFIGKQTIGYRTYAEMSWTNDSSQFSRWLCGESTYITGHTRVMAGG
jgi:hypothetical protein